MKSLPADLSEQKYAQCVLELQVKYDPQGHPITREIGTSEAEAEDRCHGDTTLAAIRRAESRY